MYPHVTTFWGEGRGVIRPPPKKMLKFAKISDSVIFVLTEKKGNENVPTCDHLFEGEVRGSLDPPPPPPKKC